MNKSLPNRISLEGLLWDEKKFEDDIQLSKDHTFTLDGREIIFGVEMLPLPLNPFKADSALGVPLKRNIIESAHSNILEQGGKWIFIQMACTAASTQILCGNDATGSRWWLFLSEGESLEDALVTMLSLLAKSNHKPLLIIATLELMDILSNLEKIDNVAICVSPYYENYEVRISSNFVPTGSVYNRNHLNQLESESIHIIREVVAENKRPVMLYSIGKDSAVMWHLARKAFYPGRPPFPLLHIDTGWKFRAMYAYRDALVSDLNVELLVYKNPEGLTSGLSPFDRKPSRYTDLMKTQALKIALDNHRFDAAFGGARRDEEKSRAKERIFSVRNSLHQWDPKKQRPEFGSLYNSRLREDETVRVFPLSNWTELDIWTYILKEQIPIVPLYLSAQRPVVDRNGLNILVDDDRFVFAKGEQPTMKRVRFRSLGCYPLSGAVESDADTIEKIIMEIQSTTFSERQSRSIDKDEDNSMEQKKMNGYF